MSDDQMRSLARDVERGKARILAPDDAVAKAPSPHRERYAAMRRIGVVTSRVGAFGGLAGVVGTAVTYESWLLESGTPMTGWAVFFAVALLAGFLLVVGGTSLAVSAGRRDANAGVMTAAELSSAPSSLKEPMLEALRAAETIRRSTAYREGWLTGIDLDAALWELAQHVKVGAELDDSPMSYGRFVLADSADRVRSGADKLLAITEQIEAFDGALAAPVRRGAIESARAQQEAERAARLSTSRAEIDAIEPVLDDVVDRIVGQLAAYNELRIDDNGR